MNILGHVGAYKQKDARSDKDLADNVESCVGLVLRNRNTECEGHTTDHAEGKAQYRVDELPAVRMEQAVEERQNELGSWRWTS